VKIHLIGEAGAHKAELEAHLDQPYELVVLPREAAYSASYDAEIGRDDVVVSLRFTRTGRAPAFRLLHVPGAGLDGIDLSCLDERASVCNVFEHETPMAEYVLGCLLEWEIRAADLRAGFAAEAWSDRYRNRVPHGEVHGKTLVLLGYGRIGRAVAHRARAFGVYIVAVDPVASDADDGVEIVSPDHMYEVLANADYLVVACPLTDRTECLIDARALGRMKSSAVLVNTSRAEIVNEDALYEALVTGMIAGAFLDVWYAYPKDNTDDVAPSRFPLIDLPNTFCTPHSSAWTENLPRRRYAVIADNINRLQVNRPLRNLVRNRL
jgi:phosphoglycerate dehydrogenase-like enzyme